MSKHHPLISANNENGIVPPVLSRSTSSSPCPLCGAGVEDDETQSGILYYPDDCPVPVSTTGKGERRKTKGRKAITYSCHIKHSGAMYEVNNNKSGLYSRILHRLIDELDKSLALWGRVFALRFDLHHKGITTFNNKWLSKFFKNLKRRLERAYSMPNIGYGWVREHERGKAQHYHAVIFLDGDKIRHSSKINQLIRDTWEKINPANHVFHPENQYYFVDSDDVKKQLVYRISYFAKTRGKGYRQNQVKDFYCSSLVV